MVEQICGSDIALLTPCVSVWYAPSERSQNSEEYSCTNTKKYKFQTDFVICAIISTIKKIYITYGKNKLKI